MLSASTPRVARRDAVPEFSKTLQKVNEIGCAARSAGLQPANGTKSFHGRQLWPISSQTGTLRVPVDVEFCVEHP